MSASFNPSYNANGTNFMYGQQVVCGQPAIYYTQPPVNIMNQPAVYAQPPMPIAQVNDKKTSESQGMCCCCDKIKDCCLIIFRCGCWCFCKAAEVESKNVQGAVIYQYGKEHNNKAI